MKTCSKCSKHISIKSFYKDKTCKGGRRSICRNCDIDKAKIWNSGNKDAHVEHERKHRTNNKETVKKNKIRYVKKNSENIRNTTLKTKYGITLTQYGEMLVKQNSKCAICDIDKSKLTRALCVDHDHKTGKVRALLCHNCNSSLGFANDNIEVINNMVDYLNHHKDHP